MTRSMHMSSAMSRGGKEDCHIGRCSTYHLNDLLFTLNIRKAEVTLEYNPPRKGSLSSDSNRTFCMVGHQTSQEDTTPIVGQMSLGNLLLFNGECAAKQNNPRLCCW